PAGPISRTRLGARSADRETWGKGQSRTRLSTWRCYHRAMPRFVASIDQRTTSTRCCIFDRSSLVAIAQKEHRQIFPKPGWVEHDPAEIWQRTQEVVAGSIAKAGAKRGDIAAVGITNQRETTLVWDRQTGHPIHNAIVW